MIRSKGKWQAATLWLATMICLSSCGNQEEAKYPGFTVVPQKDGHSQFFVDKKTVKEISDGVIQFELLQTLPKGYAIQTAYAKLGDKLMSSEGVKYEADGTTEGKFPGISVDLQSEANANLKNLAKFVYGLAQEKKQFSGAFEEQKAMEALYGEYRPDLSGCVRKSVTMPGSTEVTAEAIARPFLSRSFSEHGVKKHILLIATMEDNYTCHACTPLCSAAIFAERDGVWKLETLIPDTELGAEYGQASKCKWEQIGKDKYAVAATRSGGGNGNFYNALMLISFDDGKMNELFNHTAEWQEQGQEPDLKISFVKSDKEMWDADLKNGNPHGGEKANVHLKYANGEYVEVKAAASVPAGTGAVAKTAVPAKSNANEAGDSDTATTTTTSTSGEAMPKTATPVKHDDKAAKDNSKKTHVSKQPEHTKPHAPTAARKKQPVYEGLDPRLFVDH